MILLDKFKWLNDYDDTLFHYTTCTNAMQYILPSMKLRFSRFDNFRDPKEKLLLKPLPSYFINATANTEEIKKIENKYPQILKEFKRLKEKCRIACFCSNQVKIEHCLLNFDVSNKNFNESYKSLLATNPGYLKARMWDQYSDGYTGVCLVFSKKILIESLSGYNILNEHINYTNDSYPQVTLNNSINDESTKIYQSLFFRKNIDYKGESEYRFIVNIKSDDDFFLNISNSLKAIILGTNFQECKIKTVNCLLDNKEIKLLQYKIHTTNFKEEIVEF